ncbi:MAG: microcin C ABC transporter permease YejB [Pseudomonadota bacterium]
MLQYVLKRLLLIIPTLFGIMFINFLIVQWAPGGPVEQAIAQLRGWDVGATQQLGGTTLGDQQNVGNFQNSQYRGAQGLPLEIIERIEKQFGFDKPWYERFGIMVKNYLTFDFGESYYIDRTVLELLAERLPVSISLGLWSTLLTYLISIPLGIRKALHHGSTFDVSTSFVVVIGYAIPSFLFAILLVVLFAGGTYWQWFPLRGLTSDNFDDLSLLGKITDYFWHLALPTLAMVIGNFATLTLLTKNSFLEEIHKNYVTTARAKGCNSRQVLYGHVFRNAMLVIVSGLPSALISVFFTSGLLIEYIFSLNGIGLLSFESTLNRDYPVVFGTLYIFTIIGLLIKLISDLTYVWIDPRIDFETRNR